METAGGHEIAMALRAAYWAMHREADALLQPHGVTANQFVLMSILAGEHGLTQQELVRRASSDANTVRAMLVLLERRGLVSRRPHATDGRARAVALTAEGRASYAALWARSRGFHRQLLSAVGPGGAAAFVRGLRSVELMNGSMAKDRQGTVAARRPRARRSPQPCKKP